MPKLVKPDIPEVSVDEIVNSKSDKPVPNLITPKFKAPKKKSSGFQAPTKNEAIGRKRHQESPSHGLEEPPKKKTNLEDIGMINALSVETN